MFAKIRQFITSKPELLSTQLSKLEGNIEAECNAIRTERMITPRQVVRISGITPGQKPFEPGQLVVADNANGNVALVVAAPRTDLIGQPLVIIVTTTSANTVTIRVAPPKPGGTQGKIDGGSQLVVAAAGVYMLFTDGQDWWQ